MNKIRIAVIALVSVLALGAVTTAVAKKKTVKVKTSVTAKYVGNPSDPYYQGDKFQGKVQAKKKPCKKKRKVVVKSKGSGEKVGSDTTNKKGKFAIDAAGFGPGNYSVQVKKGKAKKKKKKYVCKSAKANVKVLVG